MGHYDKAILYVKTFKRVKGEPEIPLKGPKSSVKPLKKYGLKITYHSPFRWMRKPPKPHFKWFKHERGRDQAAEAYSRERRVGDKIYTSSYEVEKVEETVE